MTIEQFDKTEWRKGMTATHSMQSGEYEIQSIDFDEKTVGIKVWNGDTDDAEIHWARCENITLA